MNCTIHDTQVAIVGAGPAGIAAAIEAARAGARVAIVDEGCRPGGQIYRQAPAAHLDRAPDHSAESPGHRRGTLLLQELAQYTVTALHGATVWDAAPDRLAFELAGEPHLLRCERLILAPGAYDRCLPFPGWTLPGVITAGAAQVLVRGFRVRPGTRALVAGTGPLLLPTVTALAGAGVEVVAALEANRRTSALRAGIGVLRSGRRLREAWHYLRALRRGRVDFRTGWTILRADGSDVVGAASIAPVDRDGRPQRGRAERVEVDVICTGFGLLPSVELAVLLGCAMHDVAVRGGPVPRHDADMQTTVPGVYVAGEIAGIGGADVAVAEGTIAGIAAARSLGLGHGLGLDERRDRAQRERRRERAVSDALLRAFDVLPGLLELADDDTIACRCEDVTLAQVRRAAELFGADLRAVKMGSRAGMGPCQGRICQAPIAGLLGQPQPCPVVQAPVKPVAAATMAATWGPGGNSVLPAS